MMCYCSKGLDLLRRTLCLFLCVVLLLCFFLVPRAHAVVAEAELAYWGGAIVVSVLAAGGMALATGDAQKVGSAMWTALKDTGGKAWDSLSAMAAWAASAGSKVKDAAFRVGADVWRAITDCFNKSYVNGKFSLPVPVTGGLYLDSDDDVQRALSMFSESAGQSNLFLGDWIFSYRIYQGEIQVIQRYTYDDSMTIPRSYSDGYVLRNASRCQFELRIDPGNSDIIEYGFFVYDASGKFLTGHWINGTYLSRHPWCGTYPAGGEKIDVTGDLVYPGDNYLVKAPDLPAVDTATGAVSWPSDAVYNKDAIALPYPIDAAGQKVVDIPFDVLVDQTTGKDITADTGTDVKPDVKPGEGTDTDTGTDVKWPTETDLSLPKLIITKFPFCIPFDVARLIGLLEADPKAPIFKVPLKYGSVMDEEITLDLSQFSDAIRIARWGELILFVAGLAYVTRNYIKW